MQSSFTLHTSTGLIALALVVVPLAGAAAQKGGAAPRAAPSTPRRIVVPRLPETYGYDQRRGKKSGRYRASDAEKAGAQIRNLIAALGDHPQHRIDVALLRRILAIFEKTSAQLAALEAGGGRTRPINPIGKNSAQRRANERELERIYLQNMKAAIDQMIKELKSAIDENREMVRKALKLLLENAEMATQSIGRLSQ